MFKLTFKEGAVAKEVSVKKKLEDEIKEVCFLICIWSVIGLGLQFWPI